MGFFEQVSVVALVIVACTAVGHLTHRVGLLSLACYLAMGWAAGATGLVPSAFANSPAAATALGACMSLVLFAGGYATSLTATRRSHLRGAALGVLGTVLTMGVVALAARLALGLDWAESLGVGAVAGCADMGALLTQMRDRHLALRRSPAAILELEAGLSAPTCAVVLACVTAALPAVGPGATPASVAAAAGTGLAAGLLPGAAIALLALPPVRRAARRGQPASPTFATGAALVSIAVPELLGGNACLCAWIVGLTLGNARAGGKREVLHFLDGVRAVALMGMLFAGGLAASAGHAPLTSLPTGAAVFAVLTLVARPLAVWLLTAVRPAPRGQRLYLCLAGLRGPSSLALALGATSTLAGARLAAHVDLVGVAAWVCLLSLLAQGTACPALARRLGVAAAGEDTAIRTFTDYQSSADRALVELTVREGGWAGKTVSELGLVPEALVVLVHRGADELIPRGSTRLAAGDRVLLSMPAYARRPDESVRLTEVAIDAGHPWAGRRLSQANLPEDSLAVLVRRGDETLTPDGSTLLRQGDVLVLSHVERGASSAANRTAPTREDLP